MKRTLIAIGLDSADPWLLDQWVSEGYLPNISRLREQGSYCPLRGPDLYLSEQAWTLVLHRMRGETHGLLEPLEVRSATYELRDTGAYDFGQYPPFYALGPEYRCAIFDVPQAPPSDRVHGVQVRAWGARSARTGSDSDPPALLEQLVRTHGRHPAFDRDHASYWNPVAVAWLERALRKGISRRSAICRDLLRREPWDLFFTVFGETHSAGHFFWHLSQEHPLNRWKRASLGDPLLRVFQSCRSCHRRDPGHPTGCRRAPVLARGNGSELGRSAEHRVSSGAALQIQFRVESGARRRAAAACLPASGRVCPER